MTPRTVFAAPRLPLPLDSGWNQRMFHVLSALAGLGPVDLVCYADPDAHGDDTDVERLRGLCESVEILPAPAPRWPAGIRTYRDVLERLVLPRRPHALAEFPGERLAARVAALAAGADLIWAERVFLAEWLTAGREKTIVDLDDLESVKESRWLALQSRRGPFQLAARIDNAKLRRLERAAPRRFARAVVCSEGDRRFFPARDRARVLVVPNGVSARLLGVPPVEPEPDSIVLVGQMRYAPNADAALWFAREILPRIAAEVPGARLYLVGNDPRGALGALRDSKRVVVTGRVEDVAPYVSGAMVSVVPLRVGGGTRIKILESLALGTPVVSTRVGAEGLDVVPGRDLQVADTPEAFAAAVIDLLRDAGRRRALSAAGRRLASERYTWEAVADGLRADVQAWLGQRRDAVVAGRAPAGGR